MIVDFHTHIFPPKIAAKAIESLESNIIEVFGTPQNAVIGATIDDLLNSMKANGIDYSVVLPIATNTHQSTTINNYAAEIDKLHNVYSFGSLHPMQEDWESVLYDIKEKGLKGIKLHPEYQQFYIDCPESVRILKKCEELGLLVVLHTGRDVGVRPPVHCEPERLRRILDYEISGNNIIAGHLGGWRMWDDVEKHLVGTPVFLDTAYIVSHISKDQLVRIIKNHGSEKVLFATDSPWQEQGMFAQYISALPLTETEKNNIVGENAKKLLQIS